MDEKYLNGNRTATITRISLTATITRISLSRYVVQFTRQNKFTFNNIAEARKFLKELGFVKVDSETLDKSEAAS